MSQYTRLQETLIKMEYLLELVDNLVPILDLDKNISDAEYERIQLKYNSLHSYCKVLDTLSPLIQYTGGIHDKNIDTLYSVYYETIMNLRDMEDVDIDAHLVSKQIIGYVYKTILEIKVDKVSLNEIIDILLNSLLDLLPKGEVWDNYKNKILDYKKTRVIKLTDDLQFVSFNKGSHILTTIVNINKSEIRVEKRIEWLMNFYSTITEDLTEYNNRVNATRSLNYDYLSDFI